MDFQNITKRAGRPIVMAKFKMGAVALAPNHKFKTGNKVIAPPPPVTVDIVKEKQPTKNSIISSIQSIKKGAYSALSILLG